MEYLFLLGRNKELSIAEIISYFEKENVVIEVTRNKSNGIIIRTDEKINSEKIINKLGGTIAIGEILSQGDLKEISKFIETNEIYSGVSNKPHYTLLDLAEEETHTEILLLIKDKFRKEKLKAKYQPQTGMITLQNDETIFGSPSKINRLDEKYFLLESNETYLFGKLNNIYDTKESEKRDMEKPARRESLAISPRLSKILINLSQVKANENLLDPFCGIGVILQEALIQDINAVGIDIDTEAIQGAQKNIAWLKSNYKIKSKFNLYSGNSKKIQISESINGIATEPSLGEILRKTPSEKDALKTLKDFEKLMINVLNNVKTKLAPNSKIAFTMPHIRVKRKRLSCDIENILEKTGLKQHSIEGIELPIPEFRKDQIVGREIYILTNS